MAAIQTTLLGTPGAKSPWDEKGFCYYFGAQLQAVRAGPWKLYLPLESKIVALNGRRAPAAASLLAAEIGADKSPAEDYILGGSDAPEVTADPIPLSAKYPATESYRPLEQQPMAAPAAEKKSGWGFFGRKKATPDMRSEPAPEPRVAAPRATATTMPPQQQPAARDQRDGLLVIHRHARKCFADIASRS